MRTQRESSAMGQRFWRLSGLLVLGWLGLLAPARGQEAAPLPERHPFVVVKVNSLDQFGEQADYLARLSDAEAEFGQMKAKLLENTDDLKGVDRTKPIGVMVVVPQNAGFASTSFVVASPVTSIPEFLETVQGTLESDEEAVPVEGRPGLHRIDPGNGVVWLVEEREDYAYVYMESLAEAMAGKERLPDIRPLLKEYGGEFDVSLTVVFAKIPALWKGAAAGGLRTAVASLSKATAEQTPPSFLRFQRQLMKGMMDYADEAVRDLDLVTLGYRIDQEQDRLNVHLDLRPRAGSPLDGRLARMAETTSQFGPLYRSPSAMLMASSFDLDKPQKAWLRDLLKAAGKELDRDEDFKGDPEALADVKGLLGNFGGQVEAGHVDWLMHYRKQGETQITAVMVAAWKGTEESAGQLESIMKLAREGVQDPDAREEAGFGDIELNVAKIGGAGVHALVDATAVEEEKELFGEDAEALVMATPTALWVAIGPREPTLAHLKEMAELAAQPRDPNLDRAGRAPFLMSAAASELLDTAAYEKAEGENEELEATMRKVLVPGQDRMTIDLRPVQGGLRLRLELERGWLKLLSEGFLQGFRQAGGAQAAQPQ